MKGLLGIAAPFFDRIANPAFGLEESEAYAARLTELLKRDTGLHKLLDATDLDGPDTDLLSTPAWLWYLKWLRDMEMRLPETAFLDSLFDRTPDLVVRLGIVDAVASDPTTVAEFQEVPEAKALALEQLPQCWLRHRLLHVVRVGKERPWSESGTEREDHDNYAEALQFSMLLLQTGNVVAIQSLRSFLGHRWQHQEGLRVVLDETLRQSGGDDEDLFEWRRRLGLIGGRRRE